MAVRLQQGTIRNLALSVDAALGAASRLLVLAERAEDPALREAIVELARLLHRTGSAFRADPGDLSGLGWAFEQVLGLADRVRQRATTLTDPQVMGEIATALEEVVAASRGYTQSVRQAAAQGSASWASSLP